MTATPTAPRFQRVAPGEVETADEYGETFRIWKHPYHTDWTILDGHGIVRALEATRRDALDLIADGALDDEDA